MMAGKEKTGFDRRAVLAVGAAAAPLWFAPARAAATISWIPTAALLNGLPRLMRIAGVPGLAIAVVDRGELAWARGFGVRNALTGEPVTDDTLFEAASMTKPVFAYLAMQLIDAGRLALDTPLIKYRRPDYLADDPLLARITVRDVLRHTSGLPNWADGSLKTIAPSGTRYTYSGEGFVWLQLVVEQLLGMGLGAAMRARLFGPAGMARSTFGWDERIAAAAVYGHSEPGEGAITLPAQPTRELGDRLLPIARKWGKPIEAWTYEDQVRAMREADPASTPSPHDLLINSAGGLLTTASDYARFMALMMARRRRGDWEIGEASRKAMLATQLEVRGPDYARGLGWQVERSGDVRLFEHSGSNYGIFKTLGVGDAERGSAIVILTNAANGSALAQRIVREATGLELIKFLV